MRRVAAALGTATGRLARYTIGWFFGTAAMGCAVAGVYIKWGTGWALLAAVPFLLLLDRRV